MQRKPVLASLRMVTRILLLAAALAHGQSFDIATVKLSPPPQGDRIDINLGTFRDGTLSLTNVTLSDAIKFAYELVSDEQLSGPEWLRMIRFDIVAQAPPSTSPAELHRRMQVLLGERLRVVLRREQKTLPHLALVVAKGGPKVKRSSQPQLTGSQVRGRISHN